MEKKERDRFDDIIRLMELTVKYRIQTEDIKYSHCVHATPFNEEEVNKLKQETLKLLNIK